MAVALVLSRYAGATVENQRASGAGVPPAKAVRVASTPMVVVSSSNEATERCPRPAVVPVTSAIEARFRRQ